MELVDPLIPRPRTTTFKNPNLFRANACALYLFKGWF